MIARATAFQPPIQAERSSRPAVRTLSLSCRDGDEADSMYGSSSTSVPSPQPQESPSKRPQLVQQDSHSSSSSSSRRRRQVLGTAAAAGWTALSSGLYVPTAASALAPSSSLLTGAATTDTTTRTTTTTTVPQIQLGDGTLSVSRTIQGYWQLAGGHGRYKESDALANMKAHCQVGMNTLDTADIYGPSERVVGQFVAAQSTTTNQQQQPPPVVCTKFCCFRFLFDIDRAEVKQRILQQCERLQLPKLPLVQFFWSDYEIKRYVDVALYLTELKEEGLIQEIGATNFDLPRLQELKKAGVPIVSHQVQLSALDRRPVQSGMTDWCLANNVSLIAFGTVASGILSNQYLGRRNEPLTDEESRTTASMRLYTATARRFGSWSLLQELLETMQMIAQQVQDDGRCQTATVANVAQRYVLQTPSVASVLIGVRNQDHLAENVQTHTFALTQDEMDLIDKVVAKRSGPKGDVWQIERGMI
ncbi:hypothetical protein ACA910_009536 [Epithemia clementina (nom. ined.)]